MKIFEHSTIQRLLPFFTTAILVAFTTFAIVRFLPREEKEKYKYTLNKPWKGELLTSDRQFDVVLSTEEYNQKLREKMKEYFSYFRDDKQVEQQAFANFEMMVESDTTGVLRNYQESIRRRLHFFYERGIFSESDKALCQKDSISSIFIIRNNIIDDSPTSIESISTPEDVLSKIFSDEELNLHKSELNSFDFASLIRPNLLYDVEKNNLEIEELKKEIGSKLGEVKEGEKIVDRGEVVDVTIARKIDSLILAKEKKGGQSDTEKWLTRIGQTLYVLTFVMLFTIYLMIFRPEYFKSPRKLLMLFAMIIFFTVITSLFVLRMPHHIYLIPYAIVPMITRVFFDTRTAFMTHLTIIILSAVAQTNQYDFILVETAAGMAAVYTLGDMSKRAHLFKAAIIASLCAMLIYFSIQAIQPIKTNPQMAQDIHVYYSLIASGVLLLLAYPLMYLIELTFGFISKITYYELSDFNQPLLRMLSEKAPGTFAHSATVSNLAAEIAKQVGADVLLVRTGALYHDIGKMENPAFFIENQAGYSPHERLTEKESAKVIINHVAIGQRLAKKEKIPKIISDFILTHHGKGITSFFYINYKNAHPDEEVDINDFSYPGPNPQTKEQAILMMADAVEAATKSLDDYTDETISQKVNSLIDKQVSDGFFKECPITFRDIAVAKRVLIDRLKSIYHTRIKYPMLEDKKETKDEEEVSKP